MMSWLKNFASLASLLVIAAAPLSADTAFIPKDNVPFGHEIILDVAYTSRVGRFEISQTQQSLDGSLALQISTAGSVIGTPPPTPPIRLDLRSYFDLQPGEYTLSVESVGFAEFTETLTLKVRDSNFEIVPALSGSWFDPDAPGHGLNIEVFDNGRMIAYWYAYDDRGENVWLVADGTYDGETAALAVSSAEGQFFPPDYDPGSHALTPWGTLSFAFDSCTSATLSWSPTQAGFSPGETQLSRLSPPNGLTCFDDDSSSDQLNVSNLFSEAAEEQIFILNGTSVDDPDAENWRAEFAELPASLGTGTALLITPNEVDSEILVTREIPGLRELARSAIIAGESPVLAVQAVLKLAVPRAQLCQEGGDIVSNRAFFASSEPGIHEQRSFGSRVVFAAEAVTRLAVGGLPVVIDADFCETGPEYLVRTFSTSGIHTIGPSMDIASLNLQMHRLGDFEGSHEGFFVLSYGVSFRQISR